MSPAAAQRDFWRRTRRAPPPLEVRTHIALADLLRWTVRPGWWWSHIAHGGKRSKETAELLQRMGLRPGIADFLLINPAGTHHWLELKRGNNPLSPAQDEFETMCVERGIAHAVARSYEQAVKQLQQWGALP